MKVGEKFKFPEAAPNYVRMESLAPGTVVRDPNGGMRVRANDTFWLWTDEGPCPTGEYEVVYVPTAPFPPYLELAKELNSQFYGTEPPSWYSVQHSLWYGLAKYVAENFTRNETYSSKIVDTDYDVWEHQGGGLYNCKNFPTGDYFKNRDRAWISKNIGIDEELP